MNEIVLSVIAVLIGVSLFAFIPLLNRIADELTAIRGFLENFSLHDLQVIRATIEKIHADAQEERASARSAIVLDQVNALINPKHGQ